MFCPHQKHIVTIAKCGVLCPKLVCRGKVCTWLVSTCSKLQVVVCINMAINMLPSGHVPRAVYIEAYFYHALWSPILWRPLCSEPNSARLRGHNLMDVMLYARSAMNNMIGGAFSIQEDQLQAG